jgi:ADP-L-glycero-D-manno-heptose 6-epimerase
LARLAGGALGAFTLVLRMGACSSTLERNASFLIHNNFEMTKTLAQWALAHGIRSSMPRRLRRMATGRQGWRTMRTVCYVCGPLNAGYSKHLFDQYSWSHGMFDRIVGLKFFNVFGPGEAHKGDMRSLVCQVYDQVRQGQPVQLFRSGNRAYADGEQQRDFVYVKDVVAMGQHVATTRRCRGLYNIGTGLPATCINLVRSVAAAVRTTPTIEFMDVPITMVGRYQYCARANSGRLRASGFDATLTPFGDAVTAYVRAYLVPDRRLGDIPGALED